MCLKSAGHLLTRLAEQRRRPFHACRRRAVGTGAVGPPSWPAHAVCSLRSISQSSVYKSKHWLIESPFNDGKSEVERGEPISLRTQKGK